MIAPLMVSIFSDGLRAVKPGWLEGSLALGVNRWRTTWKIGVRTARPAIVAGTVLAIARAIGEAVMLAMISGSVGFAPEPGRRPDLHLRALAAAGADDRRDRLDLAEVVVALQLRRVELEVLLQLARLEHRAARRCCR